jgi:hypothetical protein
MPETGEQQLKGFIAKFDPPMGMQIRGCRSAMRKRFPTANELVYDNYNFFVIGYCATERPSDCVISLAANSNCPEVQDLLDAAEAQADPPFVKTGKGKLIIRSISEKRRPRR